MKHSFRDGDTEVVVNLHDLHDYRPKAKTSTSKMVIARALVAIEDCGTLSLKLIGNPSTGLVRVIGHQSAGGHRGSLKPEDFARPAMQRGLVALFSRALGTPFQPIAPPAEIKGNNRRRFAEKRVHDALEHLGSTDLEKATFLIAAGELFDRERASADTRDKLPTVVRPTTEQLRRLLRRCGLPTPGGSP